MTRLLIFLVVTLCMPILAGADEPSVVLKKSDLHRGLDGSFSVKVRTVSSDGPEKKVQVYVANGPSGGYLQLSLLNTELHWKKFFGYSVQEIFLKNRCNFI